MQEKTRGIVLGYIKHRETSIIVNIYTEKFGLRSYIENGVRSSKSKNKIALFQPLSLLDMVVFENKSKNISRLSEIKSDHPYIEIPYHMAKSSIGLFLLEIFKKSLKEENANPPLFGFLYNALLFLDSTQAPVVQFHLKFLIQLSFFLGFAPNGAAEIQDEFKKNALKDISKENFIFLDNLIQSNFENNNPIPKANRKELLDIILLFYRLHVAGLGELKSHHVLAEVFG